MWKCSPFKLTEAYKLKQKKLFIYNRPLKSNNFKKIKKKGIKWSGKDLYWIEKKLLYMQNISENIVHESFIGIGVHWTITECDATYRANGYNEAN